MKRVLVLFLALASTAGPVGAQQPVSVDSPLIAIPYRAEHPVIDSIIAGFKAVVLEAYPGARFFERHAGGNEAEEGPTVAAAMNARPDILAPITTPITIMAVDRARGRMPIVFMGVTDPVGAGVVESLDAPRLATGSSDLCPFGPLLETARRVLPNANTLGLPYNPSDQPAVYGRERLRELAPEYGFTIVDRQVTGGSDLAFNIRSLAQTSDAILLAADNVMMENPALVSTAAGEAGMESGRSVCLPPSLPNGRAAGQGLAL